MCQVPLPRVQAAVGGILRGIQLSIELEWYQASAHQNNVELRDIIVGHLSKVHHWILHLKAAGHMETRGCLPRILWTIQMASTMNVLLMLNVMSKQRKPLNALMSEQDCVLAWESDQINAYCFAA